jgi:tetratricopeptide (TPR) repeat protein
MLDSRDDLPTEVVLKALSKVLASRTFSTAPNMSKLLRFCVEEAITGRRQSQSGIAKLLGYQNFDSLQDSNVRREIGRLRNKLRDYYDFEGVVDPLIISIPKASAKDGYSAQFHFRPGMAAESQNPPYLRLISEARHLWGKRMPGPVLEAIQLYHQAAGEDPQHPATAQNGLAECYAFLALCGFPAHDTLPKARDWAAKGAISDPSSATAQAILAFVASAYDWNWAQADQLFYKALSLAPQATEVRCWYASHLVCTGRFPEAIREAQKAQMLEHEPSVVVLTHVAKVLHAAGDLDHAFDVLQLTLQINPQFHFSHELLGLLLLDRGDGDVALAHLREAVRWAPESSGVIASLGYGLAARGHRQESLGYLQKLNAMNEDGYVPATDFATIYAGLDETDSGFNALERALVEKCVYLTWLHAWPPYRRFRDDCRFGLMLQRLGLTGGNVRSISVAQRP